MTTRKIASKVPIAIVALAAICGYHSLAESRQPGNAAEAVVLGTMPLDRAVGIALERMLADGLVNDEEYELYARPVQEAWILKFEIGNEQIVTVRVNEEGALEFLPPEHEQRSETSNEAAAVPLDQAVRIALDKLQREEFMDRDEKFRLIANENDTTWELWFEFLPRAPDFHIMVYVRNDGTADFGGRK